MRSSTARTINGSATVASSKNFRELPAFFRRHKLAPETASV